MITIFADGSSVPNPGRAGYASLIVWPDGSRELITGTEPPPSTSSRAEVLAVLNALTHLTTKTPKKTSLRVISDSEYACGILSGSKRARLNLDLIARYQEVAVHFGEIQFAALPRCSTPELILVDEEARKAAQPVVPREDEADPEKDEVDTRDE